MIEEKLERIAQALEAIAKGGSAGDCATGRMTRPADEEVSTATKVDTVVTDTTPGASENAEKELTTYQKNKIKRQAAIDKIAELVREGHTIEYTTKTSTALMEKMIEKAEVKLIGYTAKDVREILWETVKEKNCEAEVGKILGSFNGEDGKPCVNLQFVQEKDYESLVARVKEIK